MDQKMKAWLKKYSIVARILSLAIAVMIWFFVVSQLNPDMDARFKNIDIQITDIEQLTGNGLAIISGGNQTADVKVRGKRDKIVLLEADSFKISASVASITVPGTYNLSYSIDVPDVSVVSKKPSQISVVIDHISTKTVPASIKFTGKMPSNYILSDYDISPDAIIIKGPQSQLDEIKSAVVSYDLNNNTRSKETTLSYVFVNKDGDKVDAEGITVDTPAIVLHTNVKQTKTVPLSVSFISEGIFTENIFKFDIEPKSVNITGDPELINTINSINIGSANLKTIVNSRQSSVTYNFNLPNGVVADKDISSAVLNITPKGYGYAKIVLSSDLFETADGFSYLSGSGVTIDVFGADNVISKLIAADFIVKPMSISNNNTGVTATVTLDISCKYPDIYVLGMYSLPVTIDSINPNSPEQ